MKTGALIVDDEPLVRVDLRQLLGVHSELRVVGEAGTLAEARELAARLLPQVVFLDVQLRSESGFDLVPDLAPSTAIVFVTAYDRYALRAFEVNALDYLLKPVDPARLTATIARLLDLTSRAARPPQRLSADDKILVRHDRGQLFVTAAQITVVKSLGGNYTSVELDGRPSLTVRRTLKEWERLLPSAVFQRVHRGVIANLVRARGIERLEDGGLSLLLEGRPAPLLVSRRHEAGVQRLLAILSESR